MSNRILRVRWSRSLDQAGASAEVQVEVLAERPGPLVEVRGRLMGPRCPYASTVEVAYPLRPLASGVPSEEVLVVRAIIPEASLWDPESPFLYRGAVELWEGDQCVDRAEVTVGLRHIALGPRGLRLNGRATRLRGRERTACTREEALRLRAEGVNLWVVPAGSAGEDLWSLADELGFLVLGRPGAGKFAGGELHPSCLGWLVEGGPGVADFAEAAQKRGVRVGLVLGGDPVATPPSGISFLACEPARVGEVAHLGLPILGLGAEAEGPLGLGHVE